MVNPQLEDNIPNSAFRVPHSDGIPHSIKVEDLRLRYPETGRVVLHGVNLTLRRGEVTLLLGPSGSGKSSLALTLNGLIPHQMEGEIRGVVLVNGKSTQEVGVPWLTSRVGMVFQDPEAQIATLTARDEVAFGMENLMLPPEEMPSRIEEALRRVNLEGMEERDTGALSGGQKQRLALASTLAMGVSTLVFDEPTANLDPAGTSAFFALLASIKAEGTTILIIEHKLDELIEQVDQVAILDWEGKIAACGPPREVLERHAALLDSLGVWVPQVSELAHALAGCGVRLDPYPLSEAEAAEALVSLLPPGAAPNPPAEGEDEDEGTGKVPLAIDVQDLSYCYPGGDLALKGASLGVKRGDFYAIVGPNGSGKTTLARHLIGLAKPQKGSVRVLGDDVTRIPATRLNSRIGYVFQNPEHQFVTLSVYDELAYSLRAKKLPEEEVRRLVEPLLAEFGLEEHRAANPYSLSQGQKRRLSAATMLALDPAILVLDEPTFGQDRRNTARITGQLAELNGRGMTVVIITHDMKLVAECAHRVGVMLDGRVVYDGPVRQLFADRALLERASLDVPPLLSVSRRVRDERPGFPLLMSVDEWKEAVCSLSGT